MMNFFKVLSSFFPRYGELMKMGFKATTHNHEFILKKDLNTFCLSLHQSIEPYNHVLGDYIDFEIEEDFAYLVIELKGKVSDRDETIEKVGELFDYMYDRGRFIFLTSKKMTITDSNLPSKIRQIEEILGSELF